MQIPQKGQIYFGAEITKEMRLGLLAKGIGYSILQLGHTNAIDFSLRSKTIFLSGRSFNPLLHYAFGDSNNLELPHITGPLWSSVDRLVVDFFPSK